MNILDKKYLLAYIFYITIMTIKFKDKILVTGAAGFIGGKLIKKLKENNLDFIGVDHTIINNKNDILDIDLNDANALINLVKTTKPKFIFHFAGYSGPARNDNDPRLAKKLCISMRVIPIRF